MAGYFELVGKIITEKGSWYKIGFFIFVMIISNIFQPQLLVSQMLTDTSGINISGWLACLLSSLMVTGFSIQVYSNRIKTDKSILPDLDVGDMIVSAFKIIPLNIVWGIYLALYVLIMGLLMFAAMQAPSSAPTVIAVVLGLPLFLVSTLAYPVLLAAHTKSFKYQGFLNPFVIFTILASTGIPMFINLLCYFVSLLVLILFVYAIVAIFGMSVFSGNFDFLSMGIPVMIGGVLVGALFFYFLYVFVFAYIARTCDIAKERLAYSELMDSDFDDEEDERHQISDEELFAGYMKNETTVEDDGVIKMQNPFEKGKNQSSGKFGDDDFRFQ